HIETGNTKLSLPVLVDIASTLGVGTDVLLYSDVSGKEMSLGTLSAVLEDCDERELAIIADIVKAAKNALRNHGNK
ncbi:MAG: XRE family transcriptional regulator, partial [Eubacteriales bacterium]